MNKQIAVLCMNHYYHVGTQKRKLTAIAKKRLPNCTVRKTFECRKAFLDADNRLKMQSSYILCQFKL